MTSETPEIKIPNIEKELVSLSEQALDKKFVKACLFTLVIYAREPRRVQYLQELVNTILDKFPCRIIFIQADVHADHEYLHVGVSNLISGQISGSAGAKISCDQISIAASPEQMFRVPSIVIPHIVTDLPVYLLWGQNPFADSDIFPFLQSFASRVVFDSECSENLKLFCQEMQVNLNKLKMELTDINWALVSNWRDLLAQLFSTPEKWDELKNLKSIVITYNRTNALKHPQIRAIYLQGWLASRLKWRYRQVDRFDSEVLISYYTDRNPVIVALSPCQSSELPSGAISSLEITTTQGTHYSVARRHQHQQAIIHASTPERCELSYTLPLPNVHRGLAFMKEIFYRHLGGHYHETLQMISQIDYKIISDA